MPNGVQHACPGLCGSGLGCVECVPDQPFCDADGTVRRCAPDGQSSTMVQTCADNEICTAGV